MKTHIRWFFIAAALLLGGALPESSQATIAIDTFYIAYTGNTETEVVVSVGVGASEQLCARLDLYRNSEKIQTLGAGYHQIVDEGLAQGLSLTYRAELFDTCHLNGNGQPLQLGAREQTTVTGNINGRPSRDLAWSGGTWNLTGSVTLYGKQLTIGAGAVVTSTGGSILLTQGASVIVNGATLRRAGIGNQNYENSNTSVRVINSTLDTTSVRANTFYEFRNNTLINVPQLYFTPNNAVLDIQDLNAPDTAVSVSWIPETPPVSITFENNTLKSLYIDSSSGVLDRPDRPVTVRRNTIGEILSVVSGPGSVAIEGNSAAALIVSGLPEASPVVPPPKTGIGDFKRFIRGNTLTPISTVWYGRAIEISSFYGDSPNEFYVEGNTITCAPGSNGKGIYMDGGASYNWIIRNTMDRCVYGVALEGFYGGRISSNVIQDNTFTGINAGWGIRLYGDAVGNTIAGNTIRGFLWGLSLIGSGPSSTTKFVMENVFTGNTVEDNDTAVYLDDAARNNKFYNNLFRKRAASGYTTYDMVDAEYNYCKDDAGYQVLCPNVWNETKTAGVNILGGPYIGGNYWSDFGGTDADRDGLGDTPYTINSANKDFYPLVFDILVNRTGDEEDADPNDGKCDVDLTTAGDQCSLRAAIAEANRREGINRISFAIAGTGVPVISVTKPLPDVTEPVFIDGASQPGGRVIVDGTNAGSGADGVRIPGIDSSNVYSLRGLTLRKFGGSGIISESRLHLVGVEATDNGAIGAASRFTVQIEGKGNIFSRNGLIGLTSTFGNIEAGRATLLAENNGRQGIAVDGGTVTINAVAGIPPYPFQRSTVSGNGKTGIYVSHDESRPFDDLNPDPTGYLVAMFLDVKGNGAAGTDDAEKSGIYAEHGVDLTGANVDDNSGYGVFARDDVSIHITPNSFSRNGKDGIISLNGGVYAGDAVLQALGNGRRGIAAGKGSVEINTVAGKPPYPFQMSRVNGNGWTGILVKHDQTYRFDDLSSGPTGHLDAMFLEVSDNGGGGTTSVEQSGIHAEGYVDLTGAKASGNIAHGVLAWKDIGIHLDENVFSNNGKSGLVSLYGGVYAWDGVVQVEYNGQHGIAASRGSVSVNWIPQTDAPAYTGSWSIIRGNGRTGIVAKNNELRTEEDEDPGNVTGHYLKVLGNLGAGIQADKRITLYNGEICDNRGGNFSAAETVFFGIGFCDADMDGVSDAIEAMAPNGGDGNGDGINDADQAGVASLVSQGKALTIASWPVTTPLLSVTVNDEFPASGPKGVDFKSGVVEALLDVGGGRLPQEDAPVVYQIRQILHGASDLSVYWVYGPTAANASPHWYAFPFNGTTGAMFAANTVTLYVIDGGAGDSDGKKDGRITLIGAAGNPVEGFDDRLTGDINRDGIVDLLDALLALQVLTGMPGAAIRDDYISSSIDVNGDDRIGYSEAIFILQKTAGTR